MMLLALCESFSVAAAIAGTVARRSTKALRASMGFRSGRQNIALSMLHAQNGDDWARWAADPLYHARIGTEFLHHLRPHRFSGATPLIRRLCALISSWVKDIARALLTVAA
jgi:hypothetical protein